MLEAVRGKAGGGGGSDAMDMICEEGVAEAAGGTPTAGVDPSLC